MRSDVHYCHHPKRRKLAQAALHSISDDSFNSENNFMIFESLGIQTFCCCSIALFQMLVQKIKLEEEQQ